MSATDHERLAEVIALIPAHDASPVSMSTLCRRVRLATDSGEAVALLLAAFGVVRIEQQADGLAVKASSETAWFFLKSLTTHINHGHLLLDNWERPGASPPPYSETQALSGPQFLYLLESRRLRELGDTVALRHCDVAQVLITSQLPSRGVCYLLIYDDIARQFQLPGGLRRNTDCTPWNTAVRELEEELSGFSWDPDQDSLVRLGEVQLTRVSRSRGVVTSYDMSFFHLRTTRPVLAAPNARWVSGADALNDGTRIDGHELNVGGLQQLDLALPGGVQGLPVSLPHLTRRSLADIVRARPWEAWSLIVGVLGIVLSLVLYFAS